MAISVFRERHHSPPPRPTTARHQFYLNPVVTYEGNHQGSGSRKTKKKSACEKNRCKNNFTYQQRAWPSFRQKQKSDLQESILIRWMMIPVSCLASSASPTPLLLPQKTKFNFSARNNPNILRFSSAATDFSHIIYVYIKLLLTLSLKQNF